METLTFTLLTQIPTIQETILLFYTTFENVINHRNSYYIKKQIYELDLQSIISNIELFINNEKELLADNQILVLCTERIKQTIHNIHKTLESIKYKLEKYNSTWVNWLWGLNISYELEELKCDKNILENRIDNFIKMYIFTKKINV